MLVVSGGNRVGEVKLEDRTDTWLISMVMVSICMLSRVVLLPNAIFMAHKWG